MDRPAAPGVWRALPALLLALASFASPAGAVDGVIEINQARAQAGGVTPGDSAFPPVTISQGGSYRLTGNLSSQLPAFTPVAIDVTTTEPVTIDLNGFTLSACGGNAVQVGNSRIKLENGTIGCGDVKLFPNGGHIEDVSILDGDLHARGAIVKRNFVGGEIFCLLCTIHETIVREEIQGGIASVCGANLIGPRSDGSRGLLVGCFQSQANACCSTIQFGPSCSPCD